MRIIIALDFSRHAFDLNLKNGAGSLFQGSTERTKIAAAARARWSCIDGGTADRDSRHETTSPLLEKLIARKVNLMWYIP